MDTGSHLLFGVTLAGLAYLHPAVASDPALSAAVLVTAVVGSHAPDFDSVIRLHSSDAYLKHHRGWSHSLPAVLGWSALIATLTAWCIGDFSHYWLLAGVAIVAVGLHVAFDLTNAYGVQCLLPFRRTWLHLDALCLTDPWLLGFHGMVAACWAMGIWQDPSGDCLAAWVVTVVYVSWRITHHAWILKRVRRRFRRRIAVYVLPSLWWFKWHYVVQTEDGRYQLGQLAGRRWLPSANLPAIPQEEEVACVRASRNVSQVQTLLHFASRAYVKWQTQPDGGFLVTWTDLRFWRDKDWPYRAEVRLDHQMNVVGGQLGWHKKAWEAPYV